MLDTEKLHFKIGLSGTFWDKRPIFSILVDGQLVIDHQTVGDATQFIEFDHEVVEGKHELQIRLENKTDSDVVKDNDDPVNFKIVKDMLLNIHSVEIDDVALGNLIFTHSKFIADDASRPELTECLNMGWNGTWILPFESPFYIWLLETI
jgi:hypothetical protein